MHVALIKPILRRNGPLRTAAGKINYWKGSNLQVGGHVWTGLVLSKTGDAAAVEDILPNQRTGQLSSRALGVRRLRS